MRFSSSSETSKKGRDDRNVLDRTPAGEAEVEAETDGEDDDSPGMGS